MSNEAALDMSEIIGMYKEDARRMVGDMRAAVGQWPEVESGGTARLQLRRLSHQLRGSGRTYGFRTVSRVSKALEQIIQKLEKQTLTADERIKKSVSDKVDRLAKIFAE